MDIRDIAYIRTYLSSITSLGIPPLLLTSSFLLLFTHNFNAKYSAQN